MLQWLSKQCEWWTMPNQMIAYCGYTCGKMGINGASTILGHVSLVCNNWFSRGYTYSKYWPSLWAKFIMTCSLPHLENAGQWSVSNFWSCVWGNHTIDRLQIVIQESSAAFIRDTLCDTLPAPSSKCASMERQQLLVVYVRYSAGRQVAISHKRSFGCLYRQKKK